MSSFGTGSDISPQEASDLLHKLITESVTVQAVLSVGGCPGLYAALVGKVRPAGPGDIRVLEREQDGATVPQIAFNPSLATTRKYADIRAFPQATIAQIAAMPGTPKFVSALIFAYPDNSMVALYEREEAS
jgi:hypothetical protein